jgi:transcriptional/translational regulatory protein YebC/TACO1
VRAIFTKAGGSLAGAGAVAWQFEPLGLISVPREGADPDEIALVAIDAGASDVDTEADPIEISTSPGDLEAVRKAMEAAGVKVESAELTMQPQSTVTIDGNDVRKNLRMIENLEDHDDVQRVTANFELPDDVLAEMSA